MLKRRRRPVHADRNRAVRAAGARARFAVVLAGLMALCPGVLAAQGSSLVSPTGDVDWNRFYTAAETGQILRELADVYPGLTEVASIGTSLYGQDLLVMTITNEATGPAAEKPALYVDGGIHAGELTGSAVATYLAAYLLNGYGTDPRITALLDRRAVYIRPKFNPDGSDLALIEDQFLRSTPRPWDEDGDGLLDEDPPADLDGDGWITQIRVPDPGGAWVADPSDPRIMRRWEDGMRGTRYRVLREGLDEDGDGRINEDGIGGIDMNRNFPRNWEREHLQGGAGPFPLSEPETRAAVEFITAHPNITGIVHGHTSGGFVYRLPSASAPSRFDRTDLATIEALGAVYTETTGRPVRPSSTHPTEHRYGTLISWGYWDRGVIGWVPEYVPGPEAWVTDYDGDGTISAAEEMRFDDEELGGRYFSDWTPYDHPQLGPVEIGGWHSKFWGQNPPPEFLEAECAVQMPWILYLAEQGPLVRVAAPRVTRLGNGRFRVEATVENTGPMPTNLTQRGLTGRGDDGEVRARSGVAEQVVPAPFAVLEGDVVVEGGPRVRLPHLDGQGGEASRATASWTVTTSGSRPVSVRIVVLAGTGGVARSGWVQLP